MNIWKTSSFKWWQLGILKIALLMIGIAIGANWPEIFVSYTWTLVIAGLVLSVYIWFVWLKD
jgi:hypothetical protein